MKAASISLSVLAILGALAAGYLWYSVKGQKEQLTAERDGLRVEKASLETIRDNLTAERDNLTSRNNQLSNELTQANTRNTTLEARVNQLNRDLTQARSAAESAQAEARRVTDEASGLRRQVIELTANLEAVRNSSRAEIESLTARVEELTARTGGAGTPGAEADPAKIIVTTVASVGRRSSFVVLNAGSSNEVQNNMRVAISRNGQVIAQAIVTDTRENVAVAEIVPATLASAPRAGDEVFSIN
jgi:uncharacterized protein YhaN